MQNGSGHVIIRQGYAHMYHLNYKRILSWCFFDFANSSYSAVIASVIFPVYYVNIIAANEHGSGDLWWGKAISISMLFVAISSPFLGGIADYGKMRKKLLGFYTILCLCATALLYFLKPGMVIEGFVLIICANIGLEGGLVFYNAFLPDIAYATHQGRVSAWGYGTGYFGSIISLFLGLLLIKDGYIHIIWPVVALFFGVFSLPAFLFLPADAKGRESIAHAATTGLRNTINTLSKIWLHKEQRKFLIAYLLYEDGINTVIVFASIFAATTLHFTTEALIGLYLIVQCTALIGAFAMAKPTDYWGPKKVVMLSLGLWIMVTGATYFVQNQSIFFVIASVAGFGLGTIQAASRAFYTQFILEDRASEYFGVYTLVGKSSAIFGPFLFGYLSSLLRSQRPAVLSVTCFFLLGLMLIINVKGGFPNVKSMPE